MDPQHCLQKVHKNLQSQYGSHITSIRNCLQILLEILVWDPDTEKPDPCRFDKIQTPNSTQIFFSLKFPAIPAKMLIH